MADAIPVNSQQPKKVNVKPAEPSYIEKSMSKSDNLGDASDFVHSPSNAREMESTVIVGPDKVHTHRYTREDH